MKKYRVTGFARFFLVMLFVVPLAFFGATYLTGGDGVAEVKKLLGIDQPTRTVEDGSEVRELNPSPTDRSTGGDGGNLQEMSRELEYLRKRVEELKKDNERLREEIWAKDQEIARLKAQ